MCIREWRTFLKLSNEFDFSLHHGFLVSLIWTAGREYRAESRIAPSQRETALLCNDVSHWLGASLESALKCIFIFRGGFIVISPFLKMTNSTNQYNAAWYDKCKINLLWLQHRTACMIMYMACLLLVDSFYNTIWCIIVSLRTAR